MAMRSQAVLTGADPDSMESEFLIEKSTDGFAWTPAATAPRDSTGAMVSGLESIRVPESGSVEIRFTTRANKSYTVEYRDSLTTGSWQRLEDLATEPLEHPGFTITDTPPLKAKLRFYRLVTPQKL